MRHYTGRMRTSSPVLSTCAALLGALALLAAAGPAEAQWKWRDANGRITASDLPPPRDIPEKDILQRPAAPRAVAPAPAASAPASPVPAVVAKPPVDKQLEAKRRAAEEEQQAKARAEEARLAEQRAENCRRARAAAASLESGQRVARTNEKGEREILDDAGRAEELRRAREVIASECR